MVCPLPELNHDDNTSDDDDDVITRMETMIVVLTF